MDKIIVTYSIKYYSDYGKTCETCDIETSNKKLFDEMVEVLERNKIEFTTKTKTEVVRLHA